MEFKVEKIDDRKETEDIELDVGSTKLEFELDV